MSNDSSDQVHFHSKAHEFHGLLLELPRERARWEWMSFFVRRLVPGEQYEAHDAGEEIGMVILGGTCSADWGLGPRQIGCRANVFDGLPYALYLPAGHRAVIRALTNCEIAECRVPS